MEWNMEEIFGMERNMEWKIFGMEWKWNGRKLPVWNMEKSSSIPFHTMPWYGSFIFSLRHALNITTIPGIIIEVFLFFLTNMQMKQTSLLQTRDGTGQDFLDPTRPVNLKIIATDRSRNRSGFSRPDR